jgi:hypothetical protein
MALRSSVARETLVHVAGAAAGGGDGTVSGDGAVSGDCATGSAGAGGAGAVDGPPGFRAYTTGLGSVSKDCFKKKKKKRKREKRYSQRPVTVNVPVLDLPPHPDQENLHLLR